ncbi:MAG TPA: hypothetical protein VNW92_16355 [Polyangiaceae bacterium]|nr:hypothetical protein [Polyangiaceae bacterium]
MDLELGDHRVGLTPTNEANVEEETDRSADLDRPRATYLDRLVRDRCIGHEYEKEVDRCDGGERA